LRHGKEINALMTYKNFENLVVHSLEQDDTRICISKKLIGILFKALVENPTLLAIQVPSKNDPLFKIINKIEQAGTPNAPGLKKLADLPSFEDKINLKLKTRLFVQNVQEAGNQQQQVDGQLSQYVRCLTCHATLLQDVAVQNYDENIVLDQYEPQDKESLVTQFCEILRTVQPINKELLGTRVNKGEKQEMGAGQGAGNDGGPGSQQNAPGGMADFIESTATNARRNAEYKISDMIQDFKSKLEVEVGNLVNKQSVMKSRLAAPTTNQQQQDGAGLQI